MFWKKKIYSQLIGAGEASYTSLYSDAMRRLRKDKVAMVCLAFVAVLIFVAVFAPYIAPYSESFQDVNNILQKPSSLHLLGTDEFGRDNLSRILYGTRISLSVGIVAESIAILLGVLVGAVAGYYGGVVDAVISRIIEIFASFPQILFAIVIMFVLGPGVINVFVAIGLVGWTGLARVIRAQIIQLKQKEYIEAARATGGTSLKIIYRHLVPNCLSTIIVVATMSIPEDIMYEASLSFLGLGVQPPGSSWGAMLNAARLHIQTNPEYSIFPGIALIITVLAFNLFGTGFATRSTPSSRTGRGRGMNEYLLEVKNLSTQFHTDEGVVHALDDVSFSLKRGETLGIVGESGSGKSVAALSIIRLIQSPPGRIVSGQVLFEGEDLLKKRPKEMRKIRGQKIAMIFQEPMTSLNPVFTIGDQIMESSRIHQNASAREARDRAVEMLRLVRIPEPEKRLRDYPHQMSGGMRQRVMIAIALCCNPSLLICDEPTTALDVTIQAQILELIQEIKERLDTAVILITHDLGVVAQVSDQVMIMYAGKVMEHGKGRDIFTDPMHPYTTALMRSIPVIEKKVERLNVIRGMVPSLSKRPEGCLFHPRCEDARPSCTVERPEITLCRDRQVRCWKCTEVWGE